jgi:hypothetical protein
MDRKCNECGKLFDLKNYEVECEDFSGNILCTECHEKIYLVNIEELTCMQFVDYVTLDSTWRNEGETEIKISAQEILNSTLFSKQGDLWADRAGNRVKIVDLENLKVEYVAITE